MVDGSLSLGFFIFLLLLSAALLKVWCRQSKVNRLFNLFSPCQETLSCEITEQELRLRSRFENSHRTSRLRWQQPQPSHWRRPLWAPEYKHGVKRVNQAWPYRKTASASQKKDFWKLNSCPGLVITVLKDVLPQFESVLGSQQNYNVVTRFLFAEAKRGKKAGLAALGHEKPHGIFLFVGETVKNKPISLFVSWSSSLLHLREICCLSVDFLQHQSPSSRVLRQTSSVVYDGVRHSPKKI